MKQTILTLIAISVLLSACTKKEKIETNPFPFAGEWKFKSEGSGYYLMYDDTRGEIGFDVVSGISWVMNLRAGNNANQYFITAKVNMDKYMDLNNLGYTYLTLNSFTNSNSQLFTIEPIYTGADRYYIRSVADTSMYLVSKYANKYMATTTAITKLDLTYWDCIWILEKP